MEICTICSKEFSNLGVHLNKKHHITREEYDKNDPNKSLTDDLTRETIPEGVVIEDVGEDVEDLFVEESISRTDVQPETEFVGQEESKSTEILPAQKVGTTPKEISEAIFGETPDNRDKPLGDFLDEFNLSEGELRSVVGEYLGKGFISIDQKTRIAQSIGEKEAMQHKDTKGEVRITKLNVAEPLVKIYGFTCLRIERGKNIPKTWVLEKK